MFLKFVDPIATIPVSVTGSICSLKCKHCDAHYLSHMKSVEDMKVLASKGATSFLISGGVLKNGEIPFSPHMDLFDELKRKYQLKYNFHIGFPQRPVQEIEKVADVISFDFFGNSQILEQVYSLRRDPTMQISMIKSLSVPAVPHITVGILCGKITHEFQSLKMLSNYFDRVVLNVFIPTQGTAFENCPPPELEEVKMIFKYASNRFSKVALGCMQPKGSYRKKLQDMVSQYADIIVKPVEKTQPDFLGCCSFLLADVWR